MAAALPLVLMSAVQGACAMLWYATAVAPAFKETRDIDQVDLTFDHRFGLSFALWVLYVCVAYALLSIWTMLLDLLHGRAVGVAAVMPWRGRALYAPFLVALACFVACVYAMRFTISVDIKKFAADAVPAGVPKTYYPLSLPSAETLLFVKVSLIASVVLATCCSLGLVRPADVSPAASDART